MLNIRLSKDFCAGLIFLLIGAAAIWWGRELRFGTPADMGAGFMPVILGWVLAAMGSLTILRSLWWHSPSVGNLRLQPIVMILAAVLVFSFTVEPLGFVPAMVLSIFLACLAGPKPSIAYILSMCIALPFAAVVLFVWGLGLPFDLWWF